jgi:hypothetical protein
MDELSSNQKGAIAETAIVAHATRLGIDVFRPVFEAGRYDMIFAFPSGELARIQCKWADMSEGAVVIRSYSCRRGAGGMIVRRYGVEDVDAVVAYCAALDRTFYVPIERIASHRHFHLRVAPSRNKQRVGINLAEQYDLGAIAQLGERLAGSQNVVGSSPTSSIGSEAPQMRGFCRSGDG